MLKFDLVKAFDVSRSFKEGKSPALRFWSTLPCPMRLFAPSWSMSKLSGSISLLNYSAYWSWRSGPLTPSSFEKQLPEGPAADPSRSWKLLSAPWCDSVSNSFSIDYLFAVVIIRLLSSAIAPFLEEPSPIFLRSNLRLLVNKSARKLSNISSLSPDGLK